MSIVNDAADGDTFVTMLAATSRRVPWRLHAYCLMPNHYHLVVSCAVETLGVALHRLNGGYAQYFNRRHGRVGHLFQARYSARLIEVDEHLETVCAYVAANPVRAQLCETVGDWPWSGVTGTPPGLV